MSTGHIYIITDGANTKIGITTDFDKRMASYKTHNATAQIFKQYQCPIEEAKRIESTIKSVFKDKLAGGKEWFSVPAETIDRYVANLLEKPNQPVLTPGMHGVRLTNTALELLELIESQLSSPLKEERKKAPNTKELMTEHFATAFGLGIPEHKLPDEHLVVLKEWPGVDLQHCAPREESARVRKGVCDIQDINFPYDKHVRRFYHLVRLDTGHFVALCTACVSMPYLENIEAPERVREIVDVANEYGWYCTVHHEWSWIEPNETGLFLFQPKTPVQTRLNAWNGSFRKWVTERQELLKLERSSDSVQLAYRIEDVVKCKTFPMDVQSYDELCERYLGPYKNIWPGMEDGEAWEEPFRLLFEKWAAGR